MVCETFAHGDSIIYRIDPRPRIVTAAAFSVLVAVSSRFEALAAGLAASLLLVAIARLPAVPVLKRLAAVNLFMLLLFAVLPFATPGTALLRIGPLAYSAEGALRALAVTLKGNAIVLALTALVATMELVELGHALHHLRAPAKLVHLFLFTIRYVDVVHHEYTRLRQAMAVRCFRPRANLHTYRAIAHLVGMLLVRSFDRSDRIVAAMKCRGFRGRFYVLRHFTFARRDAAFCATALLVLALLGVTAWL
jgi:cobalt/nickel transport system permease protein